MNNIISSNEAKYLTKNLLKRYFLNKFTNRLLDLFSKGKFSSLLDVGCGEGFIDELILNQDRKLKLTGVDISDNILIKARLRNAPVTYIKAALPRLPFKKNSFDLVICLEVLEHLKNPHSAFEELIRVTRNRLIISVPNEPIFSVLRFIGGQNILQLGKHPEHVNYWNKKSLLDFLNTKEHPISVETCGPWLIAVMKNR